MSLDPKIIDDLSTRVSRLLPPAARAFGEDMEKNLKAGLSAALAKLDLVTREEFEIQSAVLQRTRERLVALEQRVAQLERDQQTAATPHPGRDSPAVKQSH